MFPLKLNAHEVMGCSMASEVCRKEIERPLGNGRVVLYSLVPSPTPSFSSHSTRYRAASDEKLSVGLGMRLVPAWSLFQDGPDTDQHDHLPSTWCEHLCPRS